MPSTVKQPRMSIITRNLEGRDENINKPLLTMKNYHIIGKPMADHPPPQYCQPHHPHCRATSSKATRHCRIHNPKARPQLHIIPASRIQSRYPKHMPHPAYPESKMDTSASKANIHSNTIHQPHSQIQNAPC